MKIIFRPEGVKVLVRADDAEERTAGGLWVPQNLREANQRRMTTGTIVAIGPDAVGNLFDFETGEKRPMREGDRIVYAQYGGAYVGDRKEDLRVINDQDVVAFFIEVDD